MGFTAETSGFAITGAVNPHLNEILYAIEEAQTQLMIDETAVQQPAPKEDVKMETEEEKKKREYQEGLNESI